MRCAPADVVRLPSQRFRSRLKATGASNGSRLARPPQRPKTCSNECSNGPEFPRIRANEPEHESPVSWTNAAECERRRTGPADMTRKGSQVRVLYGPPLLSWGNSPLIGEGALILMGSPRARERDPLTPGRGGIRAMRSQLRRGPDPVPQSLGEARTRVDRAGRVECATKEASRRRARTDGGEPSPDGLARSRSSPWRCQGRPLPASFGLRCGELCTCHAS